MLKKYEVSVVYKTGEYKAKSDAIFIEAADRSGIAEFLSDVYEDSGYEIITYRVLSEKSAAAGK